MRLALTDEQLMLRESVRGALERELPVSRVRNGLQDDDLCVGDALAANQGWTGIGIAEDAGGQGGGVVEQVILAEELGRAAAPSSGLIAGALAARVLAGCGAAAAELLEALATGERSVALAVTANNGTFGIVNVTDGRATGAIGDVLGAPGAEVLVVVDAGHAHAVAGDAAGASIRRRALIDPTRAIGDVALRATPARPLGDWDGEISALGATLVTAETVGAAARLLDMTVEYVAQREQFGVVIGSFQAVKHAAADMLVEIETARSALYYAAWALSVDDPDAAAAVHMAKSYAVPAAASVADKALALHGAVGFTWEHDLHLFLKRIHSAKALFGSAGAHREQLAARLDLTGVAGRVVEALA